MQCHFLTDRLLMERLRRNRSHQQFEDIGSLTSFADELLEMNRQGGTGGGTGGGTACSTGSPLPPSHTVSGTLPDIGGMGGMGGGAESVTSERVVIVANRLPVTCIRDPITGAWKLQVGVLHGVGCGESHFAWGRAGRLVRETSIPWWYLVSRIGSQIRTYIFTFQYHHLSTG